MSKASDALPESLMVQFLELAQNKARFWRDMFEIQHTFALRNIEVRELHASSIDFEREEISFCDDKAVRSFVTRRANKLILEAWLPQGRKLLREQMQSIEFAPLLCRMATNSEQLRELALEYNLQDLYDKAYNDFREAKLEMCRDKAQKSAPLGRTISFAKHPRIKAILKSRFEKYGVNFLFPALELGTSRSKSSGMNPCSRQTVFRCVRDLRLALETLSTKAKTLLTGIKTGLHSFRKTGLQRVYELAKKDIQTASHWIGHKSLAVTEKYLNRSKNRVAEIDLVLASRLNAT